MHNMSFFIFIFAALQGKETNEKNNRKKDLEMVLEDRDHLRRDRGRLLFFAGSDPVSSCFPSTAAASIAARFFSGAPPMNDHDNLNIVDFSSTDTTVRGVVLYFHGNKKNISWYAKYIPYFTRNGYEVLMIDYPGFGKSTGKLTEKKLYDWALEVYKIAIKRFAADSIIIYGKSMGTGIAAQLASVRDCRRLILETPYYDFPSVVKHYLPIYPVQWMLHYQLPTWQYIQNVRAPVSMLHGTNDHVVVYKNAQRLKQYLKKEDELITIKGGKHNNLFTYPLTIAKLDSLLQLH